MLVDKMHFILLKYLESVKIVVEVWTSNEPNENTDWVVEIIADRPKLPKSKHVSKRYCRGIERTEISKQLQNKMASNWRRKKVDEVIDFGEKIPPHLRKPYFTSSKI